MFGYRSNVPKVRLTTDRLVVRLVHDRDAWRLADYYAENRHFLKLFVALFMPAISVIRLGINGRAKDSCLKP